MGSEMIDELLPIVQLIENMNSSGASRRIGKALAGIIKHFHTGLIDEGFTKEEAMAIVCSVGSSFKAGR